MKHKTYKTPIISLEWFIELLQFIGGLITMTFFIYCVYTFIKLIIMMIL